MGPMRKTVTLLCLLLTLFSAVASAVHHHSGGREANCTVCVAAHSAVPKTAATLLKAAFTSVFIVRAEPVSAKQHVVAFALSVRPPPGV